MYAHPIGVKRITSISLIAPTTYQLIPAFTYLKDIGMVGLDRGDQWTLELTFDNRRQHKMKDLRPELPLLIYY